MADVVGNWTLRDLWDDLATRAGHRQFLEFQNREGSMFTYTYNLFNEDINRVANLFLSLGIQKGDVVALHLHTSPEFLMCLFGLAKIGAVMAPVNEQYKLNEATYIVQHSQATCLVTEPIYYSTYQHMMDEGHRFPKGVLIARAGSDSPKTDLAIDDILDMSTDEQPIYDFWALRCAQITELAEIRPLSADDPAQIMYTSGTTSLPKGVVITHANMIFSGLYGDWELSLRNNDRVLTSMPACHSNFQLAALMPVVTAGATLIVIEKYSARRFWSQVCRYRATVIQAVAMMLRTLLLQPVQPSEKDHCVREVLYFLAVSDQEKEEFEQRYDVRIMNTYGSTETIGWVLTDPPVGQRNWPSVGRPGLGYEVRIADENDQEVPAGEAGEIQVKGVPGRSLMLEYYDNPQATRESFTQDGWFKTGDRGRCDEDGWFYFVDRKSNMIKRQGENISASEVEQVLESHPCIAEAAVIGVEDPIRDMAVKAFVRCAEGQLLSETEVRDYASERLADFKVPSIIVFVSDFPRTCSMKIEKKLLS